MPIGGTGEESTRYSAVIFRTSEHDLDGWNRAGRHLRLTINHQQAQKLSAFRF
jgi:hypothetical protein